MKKYWQLFITFARIGLFTIGGGYAMLPMMQSELVERHGWATEQEMMDYYALAQCTPGAIAGFAVARCTIGQGAAMHHPMSFQRLSDPLHTFLSQLLLRRFILHLPRHADGQG